MRKFSCGRKVFFFLFNAFAILSVICQKLRWMIEATDEVSHVSTSNPFGNYTPSSLDQYFKVVKLHKDMEKERKKYVNFLQVYNKIPHDERDLPNIVSAANTLLTNIKQSMVKAPQVLFDGAETPAEVAERTKHSAAVTGSYGVLTGLFGEKPKDNNGNGEYRRVTQTPFLLYNITKHTGNSLPKQYPNFVLQWEKDEIKNRRRRTNEGIQSILSNERLVYTKGQEINSKQNYMLSKIQNTSADGEMGLGSNENELAYLAQEKAASFKKNKSTYFNPIQERYIRRHELHEPFLFERHVGRTRKTSLLPKLKDDFFSSDSFPIKESFEDILNENKPLGKFDNMLKEQRQPIRRERLD